jgi:preprotein translocase subunit Sss1
MFAVCDMGDVPRREVFLGAALIAAAGLLIIGNEHFRKRL